MGRGQGFGAESSYDRHGVLRIIEVDHEVVSGHSREGRDGPAQQEHGGCSHWGTVGFGSFRVSRRTVSPEAVTVALAPCRECGKEVSTEAAACPHCGVPRPTTTPRAAAPVSIEPPEDSGQRGVVIFRWLGLAVAATIVVAIVAGSRDEAGVSDRDTYAACREAVTTRLRSPATAEYPSMSEIGFSESGPGARQVAGYVDSENGFGANVRTRWLCSVDERGRVISASAIE